ncbi:clotting factor G beta subunit-like [Eriocheir sinensis]|uniref:clotting factor G beta subunit-like n=1 Tax=Eriocheir sinensis TaxID=95602 RepID=UPI0021CA7560|nr:clotting factor G beta subunit-like [Eriocheir sinensis]
MGWHGVLWLYLAAQVLAVHTEAADIVFPGQLDHAEGDTCRTNTGGSGTCSQACQHSPGLGDPPKCGIKDSKFLVCCEPNLRGGPQPSTDIAPPSVPFECGINALENAFIFPGEPGTGDVLILRPEAVPDPTLPKVQETTIARSNITGVSKRSNRDLMPQPPPPVRPPPPPLPTEGIEAVGGKEVLRHAWPWMALIGQRDAHGIGWFCGGVLINDRWVLTALHCFFSNNADVVRLGEHDYNDDFDDANHKDFSVAETVLYPDHNRPEAYHDLALLRLASRVALKDHISPVCLPWGKESDKDLLNHRATLTGWGDTQFGGKPSSVLQEVEVTVFSPGQCDRSYSNLPRYPSTWPRGIGQETLCAGDLAGGRDACQGDSGGPLVTEDARGHFVLAGIISRGYGCGHKDYPGLYANLRHPPYLSRIKKVVFATRGVVSESTTFGRSRSRSL